MLVLAFNSTSPAAVDQILLTIRQGRERGRWSPAGDAWGMHAGRLCTTCLSLN
ncbi:hypothetical protein [Roseimaritima ulvae]|uniref:hypothetical protein n=1 Tax=Roseimaritima ulvae TaxID=980254 RepID=UPI0012F9060F|nr:hypothetical protein [Roseimaritima ulvae]